MSYINLVMPLKDFIIYMKDEIKKSGANIYIEQKDSNHSIVTVRADLNDIKNLVLSDRDENLNFYISTKAIEANRNFYSDENYNFIIEGIGGREDDNSVERISLRVISKTPEKNTLNLFKSIRSRLKKDDEIGMGVEGSSSLHKNYFYQKIIVGKKIFKTDFYNDKAPLIVVI